MPQLRLGAARYIKYFFKKKDQMIKWMRISLFFPHPLFFTIAHLSFLPQRLQAQLGQRPVTYGVTAVSPVPGIP